MASQADIVVIVTTSLLLFAVVCVLIVGKGLSMCLS